MESEIFPSLAAEPGLLLTFILVGFVAQLIDGALGMAFGVISNTLLISLGVPPAAASASVHIIKNFTGAVSAISHVAHRNVDWRLFWRLLLPGMVGGVIGAVLLSNMDASIAKPVVLSYLAAIGVYLLVRALRAPPVEKRPKIVEPLGFAGGFLDAAGGGGWGPVVTSNLLVQGANPRKVVGTVNTSELFLALAISGAFLVSIGFSAFGTAAVGLLIGGVAAAPLGGWVAKRVPARPMLVMVGIVLTVTSGMGLWAALR
ncbi:sulfite exporter TauE/SafE family protein [Sphingomonas sp.]|uniref:sulfite exporter TauE/SafE family protein n=1 Tax=Sphingomonas sp. TaxID=28214 RepID=UPI0025EA33A8|nr:sulfite exporter TauE/SafE family protein [Sphingomonas sp.]